MKLMFDQIKKNTNILFLLLAVVVSIPSVAGLMHPGFPLTDDGNWMIIRFSSFYEELINGQFPVRFLTRLNNGYGYPVADFLYPLFMYLGVPIHVLGFSFVDTVKIIFGGSVIASALFSFLWLRKIFGNIESLVGSVVYTIFPYHLWNVYKRGSVGEVLALSIVPFILWQIERKNLFLTSVGLALLIVSHNTLALLFLPVIIGYMIIKKINFRYQVLSMLLGLGLGAFFWIPAIYDLQYTVFNKTEVSNYKEYFINYSNVSLMGPIFFLAIFSGIFTFFKKKTKLFTYFFAFTILVFLITIPLSDFLWKSLLSNFVQFPFRLISVIILGVAFIASYQISIVQNKTKLIYSFVFIIVSFYSAQNFFYPSTFQNYPDSFYSTNQATTTVKNEYMPKWVKEISASIYAEKLEVIDGDGKVQNLFNNGNKISFNIFSPTDNEIQINTVYFPGWKVKIDDREVPISYSNSNGLIRFKIPQGSHMIRVSFSETSVRVLSDVISIGSIILLFIIGFKTKLFHEFN